jgi:hypothetical protein
MGAEVIVLRRSRVRRGFAVVATVAALGAPFFAGRVETKNVPLLAIPALGLLAVALAWPSLWRASASTRGAALGYFGLPAGLLLTMPLAALPASVALLIAAPVVTAVTIAIFALDIRAACRLSPGEGWVEIGPRRLRFDEASQLLWDGVAITTRGPLGSAHTDVARLVLIGGDGTRIDLDTTNYPGPTAQAAIQQMRAWTEAGLVERISAAVADGETVTAGPITVGPERLEIWRPSTLTAGPALFAFGLLSFFPVIAFAARLQDGRAIDARLTLWLAPLVVAGLALAVARYLRLRRPRVFPAGATATIANGALVIAHGKRPVRFELRFLRNALIVPPLLELLRRR